MIILLKGIARGLFSFVNLFITRANAYLNQKRLVHIKQDAVQVWYGSCAELW